MKFKFDSKLEFQLDAIRSVIELFKGQQINNKEIRFIAENGIISNELNVSEKKILGNLKAVQKENKIRESDALESMDFSVEMETGTGKTYVYLRTILELYQKYGFKKFIIVVPSVAIREGVLKSLQITKEHFKQIYDNVSYNFYEYDSSRLNKIRQFSRNNNLEIMVMTIDSFNKDTTIMNKNIDKLSGEKPINLVNKTRPILILDEPQNMGTETRTEAIARLNPLFKLRYSATHKNYYNLVYRLTPVDAYNKNLVKKIEVLSIVKENDFNQAYILVEDIVAEKKGLYAKIRVNKKQKTGYKAVSMKVRQRTDLFEKTENPDYQGFKVSGMDARYGILKFTNGVELNKGQEQGNARQDIMKLQIKYAIREHFTKMLKLQKHGIKVLSLFFIDKVSNYKDESGYIRTTFLKEFEEEKRKYPQFKDLEASKVHNGYFSNYKSESGMESDKEAFDLIMKNKERLLSFEEQTQFIFSHSALREGWDNPNIFNICVLRELNTEISRRQTIGRGIRLPVNQNGERIRDADVNVVTVIASESYNDYCQNLQTEYELAGVIDAPPRPANARNRQTVTLKKGFKLNSEFKALWGKISKKTKYAVNVDTESLIQECIENINKIKLETIKIKVEKVSLNLDETGVKTQFIGNDIEEVAKLFPIPNIIDTITKETNLTRNSILEIITNVKNVDLLFKNPKEYIESVTLIVKETLRDYLVNGIKYLELEEYWQMELFEDNLEPCEEHIYRTSKENSIYDGIICDSEGEKTFAQRLNDDDRIKLFIKLPSWFTVKTPVGEYNPDWAIVIEEKDISEKVKNKLYLVRETKFVEDMNNLRPSELSKLKCAKEHFTTIKVDFKPIREYGELV